VPPVVTRRLLPGGQYRPNGCNEDLSGAAARLAVARAGRRASDSAWQRRTARDRSDRRAVPYDVPSPDVVAAARKRPHSVRPDPVGAKALDL